MPLVLDEDYIGNWLETDLSGENVQEVIETGFTQDDFEAYPVEKIYQRGIDTDSSKILESVPPLQGNKLLF